VATTSSSGPSSCPSPASFSRARRVARARAGRGGRRPDRYFATPVEALVDAVDALLRDDDGGAPPVAVLCHVYRDAALPARLRAAAATAGLACLDDASARAAGDASRLHVLCRARHADRVVATTAAPLAPLAADAEADSGDDEAAFLDAAGGWLDDD